ncbi:MAG: class I SAM-dependent methyltransferase [Elusimicrobiota bacterium]
MNIKNLEWDYTNLASSYDKRADYSDQAIENVLESIEIKPGTLVADIGAGTGKLTKKLLKNKLAVRAIEPNDSMRGYGIKNTAGGNVEWLDGTGENTTLPPNKFYATFFGSSFNVLNQEKALNEVKRILIPKGWFICMWNHRNLNDVIQKEVEAIIRKFVPEYNYGLRRENQTSVINNSGLFGQVQETQGDLINKVKTADYIEAWKSHATLERQAKEKFYDVINNIEKTLSGKTEIVVPYTTRIWFAQLKS